jgi:hypothetical protein
MCIKTQITYDEKSSQWVRHRLASVHEPWEVTVDTHDLFYISVLSPSKLALQIFACREPAATSLRRGLNGETCTTTRFTQLGLLLFECVHTP